jgi:hypothetical protein
MWLGGDFGDLWLTHDPSVVAMCTCRLCLLHVLSDFVI